MKKDKIIFWVATVFIFLFEGVMPALTGHTELAKQGVSHLGFPDYFRIELNIFKILGSLAIIIPQVPARVKEWAYAGLGITMISAFIGHWAVDGVNGQTFFPLVILAILVVSYVYYHKLRKPVL
ncbi:DoxX family protein [Emticicia sp. CRIBPO]|jgi:hypothetical protein|uniref:DoxX family protein n=1 Tax=Emticicia sp. CRIBPO TaxID=2683258 RepID=UPI001411B8E7|nr:DoxX family protein [Emticicia sp. CRIBPO]NBA88363.1 DoxX family protein [Emticicia sp. CRIBPO]